MFFTLVKWPAYSTANQQKQKLFQALRVEKVPLICSIKIGWRKHVQETILDVYRNN
jgi:hypothetical protein